MSLASPMTSLCIHARIIPLLMMFTLLSLIGCGGGGDSGDSSAQPAIGAEIEGNFFPLDTGNRWTYAVTGSSGYAYLSTDRTLPTVTLDGRSVQIIRSSYTDTGEILGDTYLEKTATSLTTIEPETGLTVDFIHLPVKMGDSFVQRDLRDIDVGDDWDHDGIHETVSIRNEVTVLGLEDVRTEAGLFTRALKVQNISRRNYHYSLDNRIIPVTFTVTTWFAREIGKVREQEIRTYINGVDTIDTSLSAYRTSTRAGELTAPSITTTTPSADGTAGPFSPLQLTFSERMDINSFTPASLMLLTSDRTPLAGTITLSDRTVTFTPSDPLPSGEYTLRADASLSDLSGNRLGRTADLPVRIISDSPSILSVSPANEFKQALINSVVTVEFSENIDPSSINGLNVQLQANSFFSSRQVEVTLSVEGRTLTLTPKAALNYGTNYMLTITGLKDIRGNVLTGTFRSNFTTVWQPSDSVLIVSTDPLISSAFLGDSGKVFPRPAYAAPSVEPGTHLP